MRLYLTDTLINGLANYRTRPMALDPLSRTFSALADPTRRAILARLALGETSVSDLAKPFDMSLPAVSRHLKVLEGAGLIARGREAQWRPCKIEPQGLRPVDQWLERYRAFWEARIDRLEHYLAAIQADPKPVAKVPAKRAAAKPRARGRAAARNERRSTSRE
jgi:DNA-binding transcriptional ArsR family regulator